MSRLGILHSLGVRGRVLFLATLPVLSVSLVLGYTLVTSRLHDARQAQQQQGQVIARNLALAAEFPTFSKDSELLNRVVAGVAADPSVLWAAVWDRDRATVFSAGEDVPHLTGVLARIEDGASAYPDIYRHPIGADLVPLLDFAEEFALDAPGSDNRRPAKIGWALVGMSSQSILQREAAILRDSVLITFGGVLFSVLLGLLIGNGITEPTRRLMDAVQQLRAGRLATRVKRSTGGEIGELEDGINQMARALEVGQTSLQTRVDLATQALRESIVALERKNRDLEIAQREALQAGQERTLFLARMSHEIRTPLNAIVGFAKILDAHSDQPPPNDHIRTIQAASAHLQHVIDDILQFIRLEEAPDELENVEFDPADCLEDVIAMLGPMAADKGLELILLLHSDLPKTMRGDSERFAQVIVNLANNAIKFTETGHVLVEARFEAAADTGSRLVVVVADTGKGIAPEDQSRIFSAFSQTDTSVTRRYGGTGLGLSIAKRLAQLMGGDITVSSTVGQGSRFTLTMPCIACSPSQAVERVPQLAGKSILLYDENGFTRRALRSLAFALGASAFNTGKLEQLYAQLGSNAYDLVVLGFSSAQFDDGDTDRILNNVRQLHAGALLLLSGKSDWPGPAQAARDKLITVARKPLRRREFRALVVSLTATRITLPASTKPAVIAHPDLGGLRVLAAEDNEFNRMLLREVLSSCNASLTLARDGVEVVEKAVSQDFDVILMDLHMPRLDGVKAARRIREALGDATPRILALTADVFGESHMNATVSPFDGWMLKPIDPTTLESELAALKTTDTLSPEPSLMQGELKNGHLGADHRPDIHRVTDLRRRCLDEMAMLCRQARAALSQDNERLLREYLHDLRGVAGVMGAGEITEIAAALHEAAKSQNNARVAELIEALDQRVDAVRSTMSS